MKKDRAAEQTSLPALLSELKKSHLKITEPRKAILQTLLEGHGPFSAEQVHHRITKRICDLATVYRTLTNLEKKGLIRRCEFGDGVARYEIAEETEHHHHVICSSCKKVEVLDDCHLDEIDRFAKKKGYSNISHSLEFFGTCPQCK